MKVAVCLQYNERCVPLGVVIRVACQGQYRAMYVQMVKGSVTRFDRKIHELRVDEKDKKKMDETDIYTNENRPKDYLVDETNCMMNAMNCVGLLDNNDCHHMCVYCRINA